MAHFLKFTENPVSPKNFPYSLWMFHNPFFNKHFWMHHALLPHTLQGTAGFLLSEALPGLSWATVTYEIPNQTVCLRD